MFMGKSVYRSRKKKYKYISENEDGQKEDSGDVPVPVVVKLLKKLYDSNTMEGKKF
jgi:hypothetical protein